jgi:hypothetical protein
VPARKTIMFSERNRQKRCGSTGIGGYTMCLYISPEPLASAGTRRDKVNEELAMPNKPALSRKTADGHVRVQHRASVRRSDNLFRVIFNARLSPAWPPILERRHPCNFPFPTLRIRIPFRLNLCCAMCPLPFLKDGAALWAITAAGRPRSSASLAGSCIPMLVRLRPSLYPATAPRSPRIGQTTWKTLPSHMTRLP